MSHASKVIAWVLALTAVGASIAAAIFNLYRPGPGGAIDSIWFLAWLGFPVVGAVIVSRLPGNRTGWLLIATGAGVGFAVGLTGAVLAFGGEQTDTWAPWAAALTNPLITSGFLSVPFAIMLFPYDRVDGWWRRLTSVAIGVAIATVVAALFQPIIELEGQAEFQNPIPGSGGQLGEIAGSTLVPLGFAMVVFALISLVRLVIRYRRSAGVERLQLKWVAYAAALFPPIWVTGVALSYSDESLGQLVVYLAFVIALDGIAIAIGVAILRYRLFDIDVVINKTLVYGSLALLISLVYVGIAVGFGRLVGAGDQPSLLLSIAATSVVAVGFQPARRRLQRWANRLVFGERATPYEVLAGFSHHAATGQPDVVGEVCRLLVEGTAVEWAAIQRDGASEPVAMWPPDGHVEDALTRMITHKGDIMGELRYGVSIGESLTGSQIELIDHLVSALGLLLRNTNLTVELQKRVGDLELSRSRIVAAGDEARRGIETQLKEGPLATLDQILDRLGGLDIDRSHDSTRATMESVGDVIKQAKTAVLDFAQGVYPPVLEDEGLTDALRQRADNAPLPVSLASNLSRRYPMEIETALYFTAAEALQNIVKYANASTATISLDEKHGALTMTVSDDGEGFDPATVTPGAGMTNTTQRIDTVGGTLTLTSRPGHGTALRATVPVHNGLTRSRTNVESGSRPV